MESHRTDGSSVSHGTDEELMGRVQRGDARAFEALYDRHAAQALRVSRALCNDPELATEAVQNAFLAIWRNGDRYSPARGSFRSWTMRVVHNRTIDLIRREQAGAAGVPVEPEQLKAIADERPGTPEAAGRLAEAEQVRAQLDVLPRPQREAIVLAYYGGLSHGEIAAHLSVPLGTVKGRTRMALEKLREAFAPELAHVG